jgi:predicted transport protein
MTPLAYSKHERIWLRSHPDFNEAWVQERIAQDPSLLELGDLVLKDKERIQPSAGRLDLLLQDVDATTRYEVEIQLGETDESHIIRTIEYWDIEHKRYPQYDHKAVIIAEDITGRFLNVISLFNGFIPLIALQMSALQVGDHVSLVFTKVLDVLTLGRVGQDEELHEPADRAYWEDRGTKETVAMADELLEIVRTFDPQVELKYNKFYIGLARNGQADNYATFRPQKNALRLEVKLPRSEETEAELVTMGLDLMDYDGKWGKYRIRLVRGDVKKHSDFLKSFLLKASGNAPD